MHCPAQQDRDIDVPLMHMSTSTIRDQLDRHASKLKSSGKVTVDCILRFQRLHTATSIPHSSTAMTQKLRTTTSLTRASSSTHGLGVIESWTGDAWWPVCASSTGSPRCCRVLPMRAGYFRETAAPQWQPHSVGLFHCVFNPCAAHCFLFSFVVDQGIELMSETAASAPSRDSF